MDFVALGVSFAFVILLRLLCLAFVDFITLVVPFAFADFVVAFVKVKDACVLYQVL